MCLNSVLEFDPCEIGYAIVRREKGGKFTSLYQYEWNREDTPVYYKRNVWAEAVPAVDVPVDGTRLEYQTGFHVFHRYDDAVNYHNNLSPEFAIVEVDVKDPICTGYQHIYGVTPKQTTSAPYRAMVTVASRRRIRRVLR